MSSSSRRTWIEITIWYEWNRVSKVVLLAEDVDRNHRAGRHVEQRVHVVLLAEDVDRNMPAWNTSAREYAVVLLAEDVDRNVFFPQNLGQVIQSSSSRRTWIEIWTPWPAT